MNELAEARIAWRQLQAAEANIARLSRYAKPNKAMRDDAARSAQQAAEARAALSRILGGSP